MINSPVLLITFNRPDTTQKVFDSIKRAKPAKLYVFNDGPRSGNEQDLLARKDIKNIISQVDWDCELLTNFPEKNLGCGPGVSSAITWAFNNEEALIILEDDTVPAAPFFTYCDILLEKYKDDTRICMISGNNYTENANNTDDSYFFSLYGHIWGWATWKRVWKNYDFEMKDWRNFKESDQICNVFNKKKEQKFFLTLFEKKFSSNIKGTWDYQWFYCRIKNYGLSIVPQNNIVTNIGFYGTHTNNRSKEHLIPVNENFKIINEPAFVLINAKYDNYHFKHFINKKKSFFKRIINKGLKILNNLTKSTGGKNN